MTPQSHSWLLNVGPIVLVSFNRTKFPIFFRVDQSPPDAMWPWLTNNVSLTAQFEALAKQSLRVKPVFQGFRYLDRVSSHDLQLKRPQMAWVREVELYGCDEKPWATAKSVFPISVLHGKSRRLRYLGKTPLGYVLFGREKPSCERVVVSNYIGGETHYTRQNFYHWHGHTLLVEETFSPTFLQRIKSDK